MAKIINPNAHCSECIWYETVQYYSYCKYIKKGITARKTPYYCRGYKNKDDYGQLSEISTGDKNRPI